MYREAVSISLRMGAVEEGLFVDGEFRGEIISDTTSLQSNWVSEILSCCLFKVIKSTLSRLLPDPEGASTHENLFGDAVRTSTILLGPMATRAILLTLNSLSAIATFSAPTLSSVGL